VGTRYVYVIIRTLVNPEDSRDLDAAHALQDRINARQERAGKFEVPEWDTASLDQARDAISGLSPFGIPRAKFGKRGRSITIVALVAPGALAR
jgi:para-nitrobenzyl esterase